MLNRLFHALLTICIVLLLVSNLIGIYRDRATDIQITIQSAWRNYDPSPANASLSYSLLLRYVGPTGLTILKDATLQLFVDAILVETLNLDQVNIRPASAGVKHAPGSAGARHTPPEVGLDFTTYEREKINVLAVRLRSELTLTIVSDDISLQEISVGATDFRVSITHLGPISTAATTSWSFRPLPKEIVVWGKVDYSAGFEGIGDNYSYILTFDDGIASRTTDVFQYYDAGTSLPIHEFRPISLANGVPYAITLVRFTNLLPQESVHLCEMGTIVLYNDPSYQPASVHLFC